LNSKIILPNLRICLIITETSTAISPSSTNDRENVNRSLTTGHSSINDRENVNRPLTTGHSSTNDKENVNRSVTTGHSSTNDRENVNRPLTTGNIKLEYTVSPPSTSKPILTRDITDQGNFDSMLIN